MKPQPWNVFGRLDAVESRLERVESRLERVDSRLETIESDISSIKTSINDNQKMTLVMYIITQVPVWLMLMKK